MKDLNLLLNNDSHQRESVLWTPTLADKPHVSANLSGAANCPALKLQLGSVFRVTQAAEHVLQSLTHYEAIRELFGDVLTKRRKQNDSDSFIVRLLDRNQMHDLVALNRDCAVYIRELGLAKAKQRCRNEVGGVFKRQAREFNMRRGDFWAEMAAIRVLLTKGFQKFELVGQNQQNGATNDYRAWLGDTPAYIEIKNLHPNETVFDVFIREIGRAYDNEPSNYSFHLTSDYASEYPPTGEQECLIKDFILTIKGRTPPFRERLSLIRGIATVDVSAGAGDAHLCRGVGGDCPEPVDEDWLLRKVRSKAEEARRQIPGGNHVKVLVLNVDTTSAMLNFQFVEEATRQIREVFAGEIRPYVLHFRSLVEI